MLKEKYKEYYEKIEQYLHSLPNAWWVVFIVNALIILTIAGLSFVFWAALTGSAFCGFVISIIPTIAICYFINPKNWI